jgi:beta-galactosidase
MVERCLNLMTDVDDDFQKLTDSRKKLFNDGWKFAKFPLDSSYEEMSGCDSFVPVPIPHDWMIFDTDNLYENSIGFYRKSFVLTPEELHTYIVRFEGVYMDSKVYLNHSLIKEWKYGYSTFDVFLEDLKEGENIIDVVCTYKSPNSRWYSGAGIYRNVWFFDKDAAYIPLDGCYIFSKNTSGDEFKLYIDCEVLSMKPSDGRLIHKVKDAKGIPVAEIESYVPLCREVYVKKLEIDIKDVHRWDIDDPYLYEVETSLYADDALMDTIITVIGFKSIRFDPDEGFFLNERRVKINGACQHHDLGALGAAVNKTALKRQISKLKEMGVNSIRTSHNMPSVELMELADEMGILINSEGFDMWERTKTENDYGNYFPLWWKEDTKSWIRRDRNHVSIIIWSIGNEIYDTHVGNGYKWTILLRDAVREYDYRHNGYIGIGSNYIEWEGAQKCANELELSGYNYGESLYDEHHKKYPDWCIFGSETSSTVQSRGIYHFPLSVNLLTCDDGQCSCLGNCTTNWGAKNTDAVISKHRDRDFVFGQYIWTGWDYIGEPTPYFTKNSYFGQIDTAGFEKDTFYHYQAEWTPVSDKPMVHVLPYWDFNEGQLIDVCVYSNADSVGLYLNDGFLGKKSIDHLHGEDLKACWQVPYIPGELKAVAYDENGNIIATDIQRSFKDPAALRLRADKSELKANPEDLIFVTIDTVDEDGNHVANAVNRVNVSVEGAAILVGLDNGDSTDYDQYKGTSRNLFSGKLLAILASNGKTGDIKIKVESDGLKNSELTLKAVSSFVRTGSAFMTPNFTSEEKHEIPVRKIDLKNLGVNTFTPENKETDLEFKLYPENNTYPDVVIKAMTYDGVEANFVKTKIQGNNVHISVFGDGEFRVTASAKNGSNLNRIISEIAFKASGLGEAALNPYEFIPGIRFDKCSHKGKLSFEGGVFVPAKSESYLTYSNVDFGDVGSDEITLPIFIFEDEMPLSVWEGGEKDGECLGAFTYRAKSMYNHYQENTFKLSKRLKGVTKITFKFESKNRFSLKGFSFKKYEKAYEKLYAAQNTLISGDSFNISGEAVTDIGNNVCIEFDRMNFTNGVKNIKIFGRSNNEKTSVHILFKDDSETVRQMVEIPYSADLQEFSFPLKDIRINGSVSFVFLPGSNFDFKWFVFE